MEPIDLGYLAGILDGEGCFSMKTNQFGKSYPRVQVHMTDLDILERCQKLTGFGAIDYRGLSNEHANKPSWVWEIRKQYEAAELMFMVYPLMSARRQQKIIEILSDWKGVE